jgi:ribosomal protein L28
MKLPEFKAFDPFNALKDQMGIPRDVYGNLHVEFAPGRLTLTELKTLGTPAGLDVSIDDIVVLPDGTLGLKGQRVVLYIRDKSNYGTNYSDPRYHLANCATLVQMRENNRFGKYVANNSTSRRFEMNLIKHGTVSRTTRELLVCQNCLDFLKFRNFALSQPATNRETAVARFSLLEFFEKYPKSFHTQFPKYDSKSAPLNDYPAGWEKTSLMLREKARWRCENLSCRVDLSTLENKRFLHVHHKNGEKNDISNDNLQVLCIYCHANTGLHQHMKSNKDYKEFLLKRPGLLAAR